MLGQTLQAAAFVQASILPIQSRSTEGISEQSVYFANYGKSKTFPS